MRKKIYFFCIIVFLIVTGIHSQTPIYQWAKSVGSTQRDWSYGVAADASGNSFITGIFTGTFDFDPGPGVDNHTSNGGTDIFLAKFDPSGNFLWAQTFGSASGPNDEKGTSVVTDASGNVYFTGWFLNTVDFDPGPGTANLTATATSGFTNSFVAKFDPSGNYIWAFQIGGAPLTTAYGNGIAIDASSNIYVTGGGNGNLDFDPGPGAANFNVNGSYWAKYTSAGAYVYGYGTTGGGVTFNSIATDQSGNAVLTGELTTNSSDFDPGPGSAILTGAGVADVCIAKYDPSGNYLWAEQLNGTGFDYATGVTVDPANNIAITGYFENTIDLNPGAGVDNYTPNPTGISEAFVAKYNSSGNYLWGFPIGSSGNNNGELCEGICSDISGNIYVTGGYAGTVDMDPGAGTANLTVAGGRDIYIGSYSPTGNYLSSFKIGSVAYDLGFGITVNAQGYIYLTGFIADVADFDPGSGSANLSADGSAGDIFIAKYSSCSIAPLQPGSINGITQLCNGTTNTYSITPVAGATTYTWTLPGGWTGNSNSNSITATASSNSGTISVTANNACGSSSPQTLTVAVSTISTTATSTNLLCNGSCNGTATGNPSGGFAPYMYTWNPPGATSLTATNLCAGNYTFTVTDNLGCSATTSVVITQPAPIPGNATALPNAVCTGNCSNLDITPSPGSGCSFNWSPASGLSSTSVSNPTACPAVTTTYTCTITDAGGCTKTTTVTVTVYPPPSLFVSGGGNFCAGTNLCFTMNGGFTSYSWAGPCGFNSTLQNPCINSIQNSCGGSYSVTAVDIHGCTNTTTVSVAVNALPTVTYNETQTMTCVNWSPVSLSAGSPSGGTYSGTAVTGNTFAPAAAGAGTFNIVYTYTNGNGCTSSDTSQITVDLCLGIQTANENSIVEIFPNPFHNSIILRCDNPDGNASAEIFNVLGELVLTKQISESTSEINLVNLESGVYFIKFTSGRNSITKKIIKE